MNIVYLCRLLLQGVFDEPDAHFPGRDFSVGEDVPRSADRHLKPG